MKNKFNIGDRVISTNISKLTSVYQQKKEVLGNIFIIKGYEVGFNHKQMMYSVDGFGYKFFESEIEFFDLNLGEI